MATRNSKGDLIQQAFTENESLRFPDNLTRTACLARCSAAYNDARLALILITFYYRTQIAEFFY
jgi:hypothetical protein